MCASPCENHHHGHHHLGIMTAPEPGRTVPLPEVTGRAVGHTRALRVMRSGQVCWAFVAVCAVNRQVARHRPWSQLGQIGMLRHIQPWTRTRSRSTCPNMPSELARSQRHDRASCSTLNAGTSSRVHTVSPPPGEGACSRTFGSLVDWPSAGSAYFELMVCERWINRSAYT